MNAKLWKILQRGALLCLVLGVLFSLCLPAMAQLYAGSITGVVQDQGGAVVANAKVTITDVAKGFKSEVSTDRNGHYLFGALPPATYKLSVEAPGFATSVVPDITLNVNQNASASVTLKVGAVTAENIEVRAVSEGVQTQDGSVGQVVDRRMINDLPLVGRQVYDLAMLAPGVSQPTGKAFGPGAGGQGNNFVSQGSRNGQADILLDGITTTNYEQNTGFTLPLYTPSADAVQEFKIQQTNFSAEFGFSGSTVVNVVTQSGGNQFHGTTYEYVRNNIFNAPYYTFPNQAPIGTPAYHRNDFGGNFGGPIIKNKMFFFFDYDGSREITPQNVTLGLPTAAERTGDFSALCSSGFDGTGKCTDPKGQLWDPFMIDTSQSHHVSTTYIPYNDLAAYASQGSYWNGSNVPLTVAPGNLLNPVAQKVMQFLPLPNGAGLNNNYTGSASNVNNGNQFDVKVDDMLTTKDVISGRFSHSWGNSQLANIFGNPFDSNTQGPTNSVSYQGAINYTHTFTPATLLTWTFGATHNWAHTMGVSFDSSTLGLPANIANTNTLPGTTTPVQVAPAFQIDGYSGENGNANFGGQPWALMLYGQDLAQTMMTLSHVTGRHEMKFGAEARLHRINFTQYGLPAGHWQFQPAGTAQDQNSPVTTGGDGIASFIMGWGTGWNSYEVPPSPATQNYQYAWFFQDNWRVTDKLTLNLGFRYDLDMPRTERHDRMSYFDPSVPAPIQLTGLSATDLANCPACAHLMGSIQYVGGKNPHSPYNTYFGAVGPRLGFAYAVRPSTVIRGGFGMYYDPAKTGAAGAGSGSGGFQNYDVYTTWGATSDGGQKYPASRSMLGFPVSIALPSGNSQGVFAQLGNQISGIPIPTFNALPREYSWSLGVQHEFPWKLIAEAEYVGKHAENLAMGGDTYYYDHMSPELAKAFIADPSKYQGNVPIPCALQTAIGAVTPPWSNPLSQGAQQGQQCSWYGAPLFSLQLPFPQYAFGLWGDSGLQTVDPPIGRSNYHGLILTGSKPFSNGLQFLVTYMMQKSMDDASIAGNNVWVNGVAGATLARIQDPNNLGAEYSLSQFDLSKIFQATAIYDLPFGKGKHWSADNKVVDEILGGWKVSGTYRWDSGLPIILLLNGGTSLPTYGPQRPDLTGVLQKNQGTNIAQYFSDPGAAVAPAPFVDGTAPRVLDSVRAPGTNNTSMALSKDFPLNFREGTKLTFRWEAFNLFNHVQFAAPNATVGTSNFGQITSQANAPRIQQLSLRLNF